LIAGLEDRLATEKQKSQLALELSDARKLQAESYKTAAGSASEAIAAKDKIIENKDKEIEILKKKKPSLIKRLGDVMIGVTLGGILLRAM
jgi:hypothetical protein